MSQTITYGGVDIGGHLRLAEGITGMTSHADGSFGAGEATIDDPDADFSLVSLQEFIHEESACDPVRTFTGFLAQRRLTRGNQYVGAGRDHNLDILDLNYLLHLQPLRGAEAKRPVETGDARLAWLLGSVALDGIVHDNGFVGSNANSFDEADYTHQYADDVLRDLCVSSIVETGRIFFVYYDHDTGQPSLFMDVPTVTSYTSTLSISNDLADVDATTLAPYRDAELSSSGEDIYCSVFFKYKTGTVYRHNATTHATYFASKGYHRQAVFETTRVGSEATAIRHADAFLANHAGDLDTITCQLLVPASQVNLIEAGMRVNSKFTHFPGYDTFGYLRVASRTVGLSPLSNGLYDMRLVLSNRTVTPAGGGDTGGFPYTPPPCSTPTLVQSKSGGSGFGTLTVTLDAAPTVGNTLVIAQIVHEENTAASDQLDAQGWSQHPSSPLIVPNPGGATNAKGHCRLWYKVSSGTETATAITVGDETELVVMEFSGSRVLSDSDSHTTNVYIDPDNLPVATGSVTTATNDLVVAVGIGSTSAINQSVIVDEGTIVDEGGGIVAQGPPWAVMWEAASGAGTADPVFTFHGTLGPIAFNGTAGLVMSLGCSTSAADNPPASGQWVYGEVITMAGAVGTTDFSYAAGSLIVRVDGVLISRASYTETDPSAGTFTLAWIPDADEVVTVDYQGM